MTPDNPDLREMYGQTTGTVRCPKCNYEWRDALSIEMANVEAWPHDREAIPQAEPWPLNDLQNWPMRCKANCRRCERDHLIANMDATVARAVEHAKGQARYDARLEEARLAYKALMRCEKDWTWRCFKDLYLEPRIAEIEAGHVR